MTENIPSNDNQSVAERIRSEKDFTSRLNAHPLWQTPERRLMALNQMFADSPRKAQIISSIAFGGSADEAAWNLLECVKKKIQTDVAGSKTIDRVIRFLDASPGDVESPEEKRISVLELQVKSLQTQLDAVTKRLDDLSGGQNSTPLVIPPTA